MSVVRNLLLAMVASVVAFGSAHAVGGFTQTSASGTLRFLDTATLLPTGRVLIVGGDYLTSNQANTAELYDPATDLWTPAGTSPVGLRDHSATLLASGKVLVAGGWDGVMAISNKSAIYDPATNAWTPAGDLQTPRHSHTATLLPDGKVLIVGGFHTGYEFVLGTTELFDPATNAWTTLSSLPVARAFHTTTVLPSGQVLIVGGYGDNRSPVGSLLFDPVTGNSSTAGTMTLNRFFHTANLLPSGKVLVSGGTTSTGGVTNKSELYDPATGNWTIAANMTKARGGHTATLMPSGDILLTGGRATSGSVDTSAELYRSGLGTFAPTAMSRYLHDAPSATLLSSGKVFIFGSRATIGEIFDPFASTHLVTFTVGAGGSVSPSTPQEVVTNSTTEVDVTPNFGHYVVVGGSCGGKVTGERFKSDPIVADCTVDITFQKITNAVTPIAGAHGTINPSTIHLVDYFSTVQFSLTPDPNYRASVDSDCPHVRTTYANTVLYVDIDFPHRDCSIAGKYELMTYSIFTTAGPGGKITPGGERVATHGDVLTFTIGADPGYAIRAFSSDCGGTPVETLLGAESATYTTAPATHSCSITASFMRFRSITPVPGPNGSISPNTPVRVFDGDSFQFTVVHQPGYFITTGGTCGGKLTGNQYFTEPVVKDCTVLVDFEFNAVWRPAGNLNVARAYHTATLLNSGKVLVAGGDPGGRTAELYDLASNSWKSTGSLATSRYGHTATLLESGKVLVVGGALPGTGSVASVELYDPESGTWSPGGSLNRARGVHTATLLATGQVLVAGGVYGCCSEDSTEIFDPATNAWTAVSPMLNRRAYHAATPLPNGEVLVAGGGYGLPARTSEIYNPQDDTWRAAPVMTSTRQSFSLAPLAPGKIMAASGFEDSWSPCTRDAQIFDTDAGVWTAAGNLAHARHDHSTTGFLSGRALVVGGLDCTAETVAATEMYFPLSRAWAAIGRLSDPRFAHTATVLPSGKVLVAGGWGAFLLPKTAELLDPAAAVGRCNLDVDGNGRQDALSDGLLIIRYLLGLKGETLIHGALGPGATRLDPAAVEAFLAGQDLDIDGDGRLDAPTDGLLVVRYLFGLSGTQLTTGALGSSAQLKSPESIVARLDSSCTNN